MTYGLIGENLTYSYSKLIHEKLGDYKYDLMSLEEDAFKAYMRGGRFDGLNITIPYKRAVMEFCDVVTDIAEEIGAVNTVYKKDGVLIGTNTDYDGFLYMARRSGVSLAGKKVLILGAGGTSATVQKCARDEGAREVVFARRNHDFAEDRNAEIIINATPVGTFPRNGGKIISLADFPNIEGVLDVIYNPLYTDLLLRAKERGVPHANGLPMLVAQATAAAGLFTGKNYEALNEEIIQWLTARVRNIVLIGMPGSGKSATGACLASKTGKLLVDLDAAVIAAAGMTIPEIFVAHGETAFRDKESAAAREHGKRRGIIIATGGGVVLREENMDALAQNAVIFFLDRATENLATAGRPLSKNITALERMCEARRPLYEKYSDFVIDCSGSTEENAEKIMEICGE